MKTTTSATAALLLLLQLPALANAQATYFTNAVNERAVPCPGDSGQIGYKTVTDINVDQNTELTRIANGQATRLPYIFPFCNRFSFLMDQEVLQVLLPEVTFVCGYNGKSEELCVLQGGANQVNIPANLVTNVIFQGLSFRDFTGNSINAYGASGSTVTFNDAIWQGFSNGAVAVHQYNPFGGKPMTVAVNTAVVQNGVASNLFDNVGGALIISDLTVTEGLTADSVIRTSEGGTSGLTNFQVTMSNIMRMTNTRSAGKQTIDGITVTGMESMGSVLFVEGSGSSLTAANVAVSNNKLFAAFEAQTSRNFNVIVASDSALANINAVTVTDNDGVDRVFSASDGATMSVSDAQVKDCTGTSPPDLLSNIGIAEDGGALNLLRITVSGITAFSSVYFATCGSSIQAVQSCVSDATLQSSAFISFDSTFSGSSNHIDLENTLSTTCRDDPTKLVYKESSLESSCFSVTGTGTCDGSCVAGFSDATECQVTAAGFLSMTPVPAPGGNVPNPSCPASPPTPMPTLAPGASPGSTGSIDGNANGSASETGGSGFTNTLPPGGGTGSGTGGGTGGSSDSAGSGGSNNGGGDNGSNGGGGVGSAASSTPVGAALFLAGIVQGALY